MQEVHSGPCHTWERGFVNLMWARYGPGFRLTYEELWKSIPGSMCVCLCVWDKHYLLNRHQTYFRMSIAELKKALFFRVSGLSLYFSPTTFSYFWDFMHFRHTGRVRLKNPRTWIMCPLLTSPLALPLASSGHDLDVSAQFGAWTHYWPKCTLKGEEKTKTSG